MSTPGLPAEAGSPQPPAFFVRVSPTSYQATQAAQGPWDPGAMHGGPPAALLATLAGKEASALSPTLRLARLSVDFLGSLPVGELEATVTVPRPGRRVALVEATLSAAGRAVAVGRGWFIDSAAAGDRHPVAHGGDPAAPGELEPLAAAPALPGPQPQRFFTGLGRIGYVDASEWRFTSGSFDEPGPAGVWSRVRIPLIQGEPLTGLQRLLVLADAANGAGGNLPWTTWLFIPTGITVTILREPVGEWMHLAARTTLGTDGVGLCHAHLADSAGPVGLASQPLLIGRR
jgi:hypothetical protein